MNLESMVAMARGRGASDLHLEPRLQPVIRLDGRLEKIGEAMDSAATTEIARHLLPDAEWSEFLVRRSSDLSRTLAGVRCRINVLHSIRGVGLAVRLLGAVQPTLENLNLHPDLRLLAASPHGLILVSGATGSGKSSTLAALIHEINRSEACHIVTLEDPVEYIFEPESAFIRQRQVGYDTPSFEQGLIDVLREDPDVVMVGEIRHPEVMRLTLNVAETGHLTFATVHSSSTAEALQRVVSSFPAEIQSAVNAQLADCLLAVVCQRLVYHDEIGLRAPELEILVSTPAVKNLVRQGQFFKLGSVLATGAKEGMWTFDRYRQWITNKTEWYRFEDSARDFEAIERRPGKERSPASAPAAAPPVESAREASLAAVDSAESPKILTIEPSTEDFSELLSQIRRP